MMVFIQHSLHSLSDLNITKQVLIFGLSSGNLTFFAHEVETLLKGLMYSEILTLINL